ncbi:MAG: hypothetical protein AAB794_02105 [Patescibacteria group bacterium]
MGLENEMPLSVTAAESRVAPPNIEKENDSYRVPMGDATVIDNEAILSVKHRNFEANPEKLAAVIAERDEYLPMVQPMLSKYPTLMPLYDELKDIHGKLWNIEDRKRAIEQGRGEKEMVENLLKSENIELLREYLTLSRQVSLYNDRRASLKKQMNQITGSKIVEVKSHTTAQ